MTIEKSTRTGGRSKSIDTVDIHREERKYHSNHDGYVLSGSNLILKEYDWDKSYNL